MKLLLDTHVWVRFLIQKNVSARTCRPLANVANELWLSPISIWEAALLVEAKRVRIDGPFEKWVEDALARLPVREAPLTAAVALASRKVWVPHNDPADRFLAATAAVNELTLLTADELLLEGRGFKHLAWK